MKIKEQTRNRAADST